MWQSEISSMIGLIIRPTQGMTRTFLRNA